MKYFFRKCSSIFESKSNHKNAKFLLYVLIYWRRILYQETSSEIKPRLPYALINASDKSITTFDRLKKSLPCFHFFFCADCKTTSFGDGFFIFKEEAPEECSFELQEASGHKNWNFVYWLVWLLVTFVRKNHDFITFQLKKIVDLREPRRFPGISATRTSFGYCEKVHLKMWKVN